MESSNTGWGSTPVAPAEYGSPQWIVQRDAKLKSWEESKVALEKAKADEMDRRKEFVDFSFDPNKKEGTERIPLHNGFEAKAVKKLNYGFVSPDPEIPVADAVDSALDKLEALGPEGKFIAGRLVKWTPELSIAEFRNLNAEQLAIMSPVIQTKEGAPTLEIIPPKGSKK